MSSFAEAFDAAVAESGLTLVEIHKRLRDRGVRLSVSTLSYWRSGRRQPDSSKSLSTIPALETALQLPEGALIGYVAGRSRRVGAVGRLELSPASTLLASLDVSPLENYRVLSVQETVDVDDQLTISTVETVVLLQCVRETVESVGLIDVAADAAEMPPIVQALSGARPDRTEKNESGTLFGTRFTLDRPLRRGETAMFSALTTFPVGHPRRREHRISVIRRVRELLQWFRFTKGDEPDWFEEIEARSGRNRTMFAEDPKSVHRLRTNFGPGEIVARWGHVGEF